MVVDHGSNVFDPDVHVGYLVLDPVDVSDVLARVSDRFPSWFVENVGFLEEPSKLLFRKRELSIYGDEEALALPDEAMSKDDTSNAVGRSERVFGLCERLIGVLESLV